MSIACNAHGKRPPPKSSIRNPSNARSRRTLKKHLYLQRDMAVQGNLRPFDLDNEIPRRLAHDFYASAFDEAEVFQVMVHLLAPAHFFDSSRIARTYECKRQERRRLMPDALFFAPSDGSF